MKDKYNVRKKAIICKIYKIVHNAGICLNKHDYRNARIHLEKALCKIRNVGNNKLELEILINLYTCYDINKDYKNMLDTLKKILALKHYQHDKFKYLILAGIVGRILNENLFGTSCFEQALEVYNKSIDKKGLEAILSTSGFIGILKSDIKNMKGIECGVTDVEKSLMFFKQSKKEALIIKNKEAILHPIRTIASIYREAILHPTKNMESIYKVSGDNIKERHAKNEKENLERKLKIGKYSK